MSPRPTSFVYFLRPVGAEGPVKIGCSMTPERRLSNLMTWAPVPLEIAATVPGSRALEHNVHQCFADLHSHREWFRAHQRITDVIEGLRAGKPLHSVLDLNDRRGSIRPSKAGAAGWTDATRGYMSWLHKFRHAGIRHSKAIGKEATWLPDNITNPLNRMRHGHSLTAKQEAKFRDVLARPERYFRTYKELYGHEPLWLKAAA